MLRVCIDYLRYLSRLSYDYLGSRIENVRGLLTYNVGQLNKVPQGWAVTSSNADPPQSINPQHAVYTRVINVPLALRAWKARFRLQAGVPPGTIIGLRYSSVTPLPQLYPANSRAYSLGKEPRGGGRCSFFQVVSLPKGYYVSMFGSNRRDSSWISAQVAKRCQRKRQSVVGRLELDFNSCRRAAALILWQTRAGFQPMSPSGCVSR